MWLLLASGAPLSQALASSGGVAKPVRVLIPLESWCLDAGSTAQAWTRSTPPTLTAYAGRANLGPVTPGTCAYLDGETAKTLIQLSCPNHQGGWLRSTRATYAANPGAVCVVPAAQDFRP